MGVLAVRLPTHHLLLLQHPRVQDHEGHGLPPHRGGVEGPAEGDRRGWLRRDRDRRVLPALRHLPGRGPDMETMKRELKDAFRIYDKEGQGFITTETLRGLITELLAPLTEEEVEGILEELDEDGSGSMDFDEFCEMMMTKAE